MLRYDIRLRYSAQRAQQHQRAQRSADPQNAACAPFHKPRMLFVHSRRTIYRLGKKHGGVASLDKK